MESKTSPRISHKCRGKIAGRAKTGRFQAKSTDALTKEWEAKLKRMGLTMENGHDPHWLTYGHDVADLDFDGRDTYAYSPPDGERLDLDEWPISLL